MTAAVATVVVEFAEYESCVAVVVVAETVVAGIVGWGVDFSGQDGQQNLVSHWLEGSCRQVGGPMCSEMMVQSGMNAIEKPVGLAGMD